MKSEPFVYIIILNFNQTAKTMECLDSLRKLEYRNFKVLLLDNSDIEDISDEIKKSYPEVTLIENGFNVGAAAGRNIGIRYVLNSGCDYIFFLDNDAIVDGLTLTELIKKAESDTKIAAVGSKTYYYDEPQKIWNFGSKIDWIQGKFFKTYQGQLDTGQLNKELEVDSFPIGFGIIRTDVIKRVGEIDEKYFIYYEETDWHIKMKKLGYKLVVTPKARIWHNASSSLGKESPIFYYYRTRNRLLFMYKNAPKIKFFLFCLYFLYDFTYNTLFTLYLSERIKEFRAALSGLIDFLRGRWGKKIMNDEYLSEPLYKRFLGKPIRYIRGIPLNILIWLMAIILYPWHFFRRSIFYHLRYKGNQILIIYMAEGLGDSILFSAVLPAIRKKFNNAKINLLIFDRFIEYFQNNPYIDQLFTYPDYRYAKYGFRKFLAYSRYVNRQCVPDILIDLLPNKFIKPAIFSWFIPKKLSIGFNHSIKKLFYDICVKVDWNKYFYDLFFDALKHLGIEKQKPRYWVPQSSSGQVFYIENNFKYKTVVLAPGGKFNILKPQDYRGFKYYPALVVRLVNNGYRVILVGAEYDIGLELLKASFPKDKLINLLGKTSIAQLFSIVKNYADLVVCNTSGLLYVALAVDVPAVFYAHPLENLKRWHPKPSSERFVALRDAIEKPVTIDTFFEAITKTLSLKEANNAAE